MDPNTPTHPWFPLQETQQARPRCPFCLGNPHPHSECPVRAAQDQAERFLRRVASNGRENRRLWDQHMEQRRRWGDMGTASEFRAMRRRLGTEETYGAEFARKVEASKSILECISGVQTRCEIRGLKDDGEESVEDEADEEDGQWDEWIEKEFKRLKMETVEEDDAKPKESEQSKENEEDENRKRVNSIEKELRGMRRKWAVADSYGADWIAEQNKTGDFNGVSEVSKESKEKAEVSEESENAEEGGDSHRGNWEIVDGLLENGQDSSDADWEVVDGLP